VAFVCFGFVLYHRFCLRVLDKADPPHSAFFSPR